MRFYKRQYHSQIEPERSPNCCCWIARHPRSVRFNVQTRADALHAISGSGLGYYANEAERLTGKLMNSLTYDRIEDIFARGLHPFLTDVQNTSRQIGEQIARPISITQRSPSSE